MSRPFHADSKPAAPALCQHSGDPPDGTLPALPVSLTLSQWEMSLWLVVGCRVTWMVMFLVWPKFTVSIRDLGSSPLLPGPRTSWLCERLQFRIPPWEGSREG